MVAIMHRSTQNQSINVLQPLFLTRHEEKAVGLSVKKHVSTDSFLQQWGIFNVSSFGVMTRH